MSGPQYTPPSQYPGFEGAFAVIGGIILFILGFFW